MSKWIASFFESKRAALITAGIALSLLAWMSTLRTPISKAWADEGTFLAMTASLAVDGDLLFTEADLARIDLEDAARSSLILERTARGIAFSKPIVLALLAAPFWAIFGDHGLVVLNALALMLALSLAYRHLQRLSLPESGSQGRALWTLVTFTLAAVVVPYIFWRMADLLQLTLSLAGLTLCFASARRPTNPGPKLSRWSQALDRLLDHRIAPWLGLILLTVTVTMRVSNGALVLIPILNEAIHKRWIQTIAKGAFSALMVMAMAGLTWSFTGALDPYRAERASFVPATGYPAGDQANIALERFDTRPATHQVRFFGNVRQIAYSAIYFWVGRHSGLLFYFPAAAIFLLLALRYPSRIGMACLLGAGIALTFFVVSKPVNYFGGGTFIGNRYFLSVYPAFLLALTRLPSWRALAAAWLIATLTYGSAALSIGRHHTLDNGSQSHTRAGVLKALPYESTADSLDGSRNRYWAGQFIRFVDPFTKVTQLTFEIEAGRPGSELIVANWQLSSSLRYHVECDAPDAKLVVSDWQGTREYSVGQALAPGGGPVGIEIETAPPWRYHGYWFAERPYRSRAFSLRLEAPDGTRARLHHLGDPEISQLAFAYEAEPTTVASAIASTTEIVTLRARNTSHAYWNAEDVTAVTARYRLWRNGAKLFESGRLPIPRRIGPGEWLELPVEIQWPEQPGPVTLELDLVLEHVDWFQNRLGQPLAQIEVDVLDSSTAPAS